MVIVLSLYWCDSKKVKPQLLNKYFDLAFVDGDHGHEGVINDVIYVPRFKYSIPSF